VRLHRQAERAAAAVAALVVEIEQDADDEAHPVLAHFVPDTIEPPRRLVVSLTAPVRPPAVLTVALSTPR
jgi:hypothetical protein